MIDEVPEGSDLLSQRPITLSNVEISALKYSTMSRPFASNGQENSDRLIELDKIREALGREESVVWISKLSFPAINDYIAPQPVERIVVSE